MDLRWAGERMWMAMIGIFVSIENDYRIEERIIGRYSSGQFFIPKFQSTAPFRLPVLIKVKKHVNAAMGLKFVMPVKVGMDFQEISPRAQMKTAPDEVRIR